MKQKIFAFVLAALLVGLGAGIWHLGRPRLSRSQGLQIKEIQTSQSDAQGATQDIVLFSDGSTLREIGYDLVHLGTLGVESSHPIFLFKSYSCRACEPSIDLWVYNSAERAAERFIFPGNHYSSGAISANNDEMLDQVSEGVWGTCGAQDELMIVIAQKHRDVESDGNSLKAGAWSFSTTTLRFKNNQVQVDNSSEDAFERIKSLLALNGCMKIEPEDRHDYL